jgi:hypothetical protein
VEKKKQTEHIWHSMTYKNNNLPLEAISNESSEVTQNKIIQQLEKITKNYMS